MKVITGHLKLYLGSFATKAALVKAYPTAEEGQFAYIIPSGRVYVFINGKWAIVV